jgi:hypothetical protein
VFSRALVRRRARTIVAVLCATTGLFGLSLTAWSGLAAATPVHIYESSFGSFGNVQGIAVDESSGDVYVYDAGTGEVLKYTATGTPAEFSATTTNAIAGVGGAGGGEGEIAVDNSSGPAKGDIYVAHGSSANVLIYSAAGQQIGELTEESGKPWGEACGVAVDRSGNVYVGLYGSHVNEYTPTANPVTDLSYAGSLSEVNGVCNIAANAAGDVYVDTWSAGPVTRYEATQFNSLEIPAVGQLLDAGGSTLAVDQSDGDVYVNEGSQVTAYDSSGGLLNAFAGSGAGAIGGSQGVAVSEASGKVYVSDGSGHIEIFGEVDVEPPLVTVGSPTGVTSRQATLNGTVNPQGTEAPSSTEWHFEYSLDGGSSWESTAVQDAGAGTSPVPVSAQITGLHSAEEVQDRLVATNQAGGTTTSTIQTFTTAAFGPPQASTDAATDVATQEARLGARINPEGQATTYHFEYGTTIAYGADAPVPDGEIDSGRVVVPASAHIASLTPGTTYHYRIVATNATGTTDGEDGTFTTYPAQQQGGECPNEARREEQNSTYLPECRAYEMVSPLDKNGADIEARGQQTVSSSDGERVAYAALAGFAGTTGTGTLGYAQYVASREGTHWSTRGVTPTPAREAFQFTAGATTVVAFSQDLSHALVEAYHLPAASDDIANGINYYSEDVATGALETVTTPLSAPLGAFAATIGMWGTLAASAPDLGVVTVETEADLLPETTGSGEKLYAWENGKLTVAGVLPDGTLPPGGSASPKSQGKFQGSASEGSIADQDGSRIPFVSPANGEHQLYLRRDGTSTVWVSQSEASVPVAEPREVRFQAISADGRRILFTTKDSLLDGDPGGLYMYTDSPSPATESNLTFIAPTTSREQVVSGISENAERVYFYTQEQPGIPQTGTYLWDEGTLHFVTPYNTVANSFEQSWGRETSADGRQFAYMTKAGEEGGLFVYDEETESLRCASCLPGGGGGSGARVIPEEKSEAFNGLSIYSRPRFITADGRHVFFSTKEALVPSDTNGVEDVYEYDVQSGAVSLLSSGTGESPAWLGAVSASGNDVFILTRQSLVRGDTDTLRDLYDVRVDGGFPEPPPQTGPCVGDECQGTPSAAPSFNTASGFSGLGNTVAKASGESKPKRTTPASKLTRAQRLKQALKACKRKPKGARKRCEAQARKKYRARKARRGTPNRVGR